MILDIVVFTITADSKNDSRGTTDHNGTSTCKRNNDGTKNERKRLTAILVCSISLGRPLLQ